MPLTIVFAQLLPSSLYDPLGIILKVSSDLVLVPGRSEDFHIYFVLLLHRPSYVILRSPPACLSCRIHSVYTNALLATLNARKMIRNSSENHANTSDKVTLSLRDMQKNGATSRVEPVT